MAIREARPRDDVLAMSTGSRYRESGELQVERGDEMELQRPGRGFEGHKKPQFKPNPPPSWKP